MTALDIAAGHDISGKTALVTGGSSGLGLETARALTTTGANVIITGRNLAAGQEILAMLRQTGPGQHAFIPLDLTDAHDIARAVDLLAQTTAHLDILVANAGLSMTPEDRLESGFDIRFAANYLGHFVLIHRLLPQLSLRGARIVMLGSAGHKGRPVNLADLAWLDREIDQRQAYGESKSACSLFAVEATRRWHDLGIFANCVLPGSAVTGLMRNYSAERLDGLLRAAGGTGPDSMLGKVDEQASTSVWAALAPQLDRVGGLVLEDCGLCRISGPDFHPWRGYELHSTDTALARQLWDSTVALIAEHGIPFCS